MENQSTTIISPVRIPVTSPQPLVDSIDMFESSFFKFLSRRWPHLLDLDSPYESSFITPGQLNQALPQNLDVSSSDRI